MPYRNRGLRPYNVPLMARKNQPPPKNYEEAVQELQQIIAEIERGEIGLEDTLARYERGHFLLQFCQQTLSAAEKQIELITRAPGGELATTTRSDQPGTIRGETP